MKTKLALALALAFAATSASASLRCTNADGVSVEWWPGMARPALDLTPGAPFVCFAGAGTYTYIVAKFPQLVADPTTTSAIWFGDDARFVLTNVVRPTRADYEALLP